MTHDEAVILVDQFARAWEQADVEAIQDAFCEDGVFISPGGRWEGHAAIRCAAEEFFRDAAEVRVEVLRVVFDGEQGAVEWRWSERQRADQRRYAADDAIIFTLREGKVAYWREYFDRVQMQTAVEE